MLDALLSAGGTLGGSIIQGEYNAREAGKARDYNTMMSNTARQRDVADLKRAGLNPVLAAGYGSSSPSSPSASISAPDFGGATNTARQISSNIALQKAQTVNQLASARSTDINANLDAKYGAAQRLSAPTAAGAHLLSSTARAIPFKSIGQGIKNFFTKPSHSQYGGFSK